tara:strand:+ start:2683 stop:3945 length:1263 start_codon:yes stop_codon:yes gene_type:complete
MKKPIENLKNKFLLLEKTENENIKKLIKLYKEDPYHARILFMNNPKDSFYDYRLLVFYDGNEIKGAKNLDFVLFRQCFGISKTNRMYNREKVLIRVRVRGDKVWVCQDSKIRAYGCDNMILLPYNAPVRIERYVGSYLTGKFAWFKFIREEFKIYTKSFNYVTTHKLFNKKKLLCNYYGFNYPISKALYDLDMGGKTGGRNHDRNQFHNLKYYKDWITGEGKMNYEFMNNRWSLFTDMLQMAKTLDKVINLSWSDKRMILEHDKLSVELTDALYKYDNVKLANNKAFKLFSKKSKGYKLIKSSRDLALEGRRQSHCVVSYRSKIDDGRCGIYHIDGFTLELGIRSMEDGSKALIRVQIQGHRNSHANSELINKIDKDLDYFNKHYKDKIIPGKKYSGNLDANHLLGVNNVVAINNFDLVF